MKNYKTTAAFPEPNYTQTPNDFFDMLPDMESSEVRVTLVMIRNTFGFHQDGFKMSLGKLAAAAGISEGAAKDGAQAAEERGTFRRVNPKDNKESEWELMVEGQPVRVNQCTSEGQPLHLSGSMVDPLSGVKESIKKEKKTEFSSSDLQEVTIAANKKMDVMLEFERLAEEANANGQSWRGRELLPTQYLVYGDWWYAKTGQEMYGAKGKPKMDSSWLTAFKAFWEFDVSISSLDAALAKNEWRKPITLIQIVADAKAFQAAGASVKKESEMTRLL